MRFLRFILLLTSMLLLANLAWAIDLGGLADNALTPVSGLAAAANKILILIGVGLLAAGVVRYFEHRRSPGQVHMSQVMIVVVLGLVLIGVAYVGSLSEGGHIANEKLMQRRA